MARPKPGLRCSSFCEKQKTACAVKDCKTQTLAAGFKVFVIRYHYGSRVYAFPKSCQGLRFLRIREPASAPSGEGLRLSLGPKFPLENLAFGPPRTSRILKQPPLLKLMEAGPDTFAIQNLLKTKSRWPTPHFSRTQWWTPTPHAPSRSR